MESEDLLLVPTVQDAVLGLTTTVVSGLGLEMDFCQGQFQSQCRHLEVRDQIQCEV